MKALICTKFGPVTDLSVEDVAVPVLSRATDVLVRVVAAGLNYPDLLSVAGTYPIPSTPPFVPGVEGAGYVVEVGPEVTRMSVGDAVCWQNNVVKGAFAESVCLPENCLARVPEGMDMALAACVPTVYGTAAFALEHRARLRSGETVLVHGASGGVGLAAVQIARARGAEVIASGRSRTKLERLAEMGVPTVTADTDLRDRVLEMTGGRGVDIALDPVGGDLFDASVRVLAPYGRLLVIGFTSGSFGVARSNILLVKALSVIGVNYGHFLQSEPDEARIAVEALLREVDTGGLSPVVTRTGGLGSVPAGLQRLEEGAVFGKIAVQVRDLTRAGRENLL
jgi:NADPH:quinone reductase